MNYELDILVKNSYPMSTIPPDHSTVILYHHVISRNPGFSLPIHNISTQKREELNTVIDYGLITKIIKYIRRPHVPSPGNYAYPGD